MTIITRITRSPHGNFFVSPLLSFYHKYITLSLLINLHHFLSSFPSLFINIISHSLFLNSSLPTQVLFFFGRTNTTSLLLYFDFPSFYFLVLHWKFNQSSFFEKQFYLTSLKKKVKIQGYLVHQLKHTFSVFKQFYTYFHKFFHPHIFPHMFSNNKTHVFKCIYQIPPHIFNLIFKVATKQQKKKKRKEKRWCSRKYLWENDSFSKIC